MVEQAMAMRKRDDEVFPNAAGIDIGASSHWVAVPRHLAEQTGCEPPATGRPFPTEPPKPVNVPGVRGETAMRYKVNGSAEMTDTSLVRARGVSDAVW